MKTIGKYLKEIRIKKGISLDRLSEETKIKKEFIKALEDEDWNKLPEMAVTMGFVKNIASQFELDKGKVTAFLRRDYPPGHESVNPKPDATGGFRWSPKLTFFLGVFLIVSAAVFYLMFQYMRFNSPPELVIDTPKEGEIIVQRVVKVSGKTDSGSSVVVNNQPAFVDDEGNFETEVEVSPDTDKINVRAVSRSGKAVSAERNIDVVLE